MALRLSILLCAVIGSVFAQPETEDAVRALLGAFDRHPIVAIAEVHRLEQDKEFLVTVLASREFSAKANDIVIEFGNARLQRVLDGYIAGGHVSAQQLRRVWADTTVVNGLWDAPIYERFLTAVRQRNRTLPKNRKLRILACDPPIDWASVNTVSDAAPYLDRDRFCAATIEREVLAKGRRALVIMGDAHVARRHVTGRPLDNAIALIERKHPQATFVVLTYFGQYKDRPASRNDSRQFRPRRYLGCRAPG